VTFVATHCDSLQLIKEQMNWKYSWNIKAYHKDLFGVSYMLDFFQLHYETNIQYTMSADWMSQLTSEVSYVGRSI
jgi:hypothetical protein